MKNINNTFAKLNKNPETVNQLSNTQVLELYPLMSQQINLKVDVIQGIIRKMFRNCSLQECAKAHEKFLNVIWDSPKDENGLKRFFKPYTEEEVADIFNSVLTELSNSNSEEVKAGNSNSAV